MKYFIATTFLMFSLISHADKLTDAQLTAVKKKIEVIKTWAANPKLVDLVKAANANPEGKDLNEDKWKDLPLLDSKVTGFTKNEAAKLIKSLKDDSVTEAFLNTAEGTKIAFLTKTTNWSHKGKPKHDLPMKGQDWIMEEAKKDESSQFIQIQVSVPVLDAGKPIGSLIVGLSLNSLK